MSNQGNYGSTNQQGGVGSKKLQQTHAQVNEVVDIMRENVEKVIDRDIKLSELDDRADALQQGASQFETQAAKLKRKYWWKNMKMWLILIAVGIVIVLILIFSQNSETTEAPLAPGVPESVMEPNPKVALPAEAAGQAAPAAAAAPVSAGAMVPPAQPTT